MPRARSTLALAALLALSPSACEKATEPASVSPDAGEPATSATPATSEAFAAAVDEAAAGIEDAELAGLLREDWDRRLRRSPDFAASLGVHDFDEQWSERSADARAQDEAHRQAMLERARAIAARELAPSDRVSVELFIAELESASARTVCASWSWGVSARSNPLTGLAGLAERTEVDDERALEALIARYRSFEAAVVDAQIADLRAGLERELVADAQTLERTLDMLERTLSAPLEDHPAMLPVADLPATDPRREQLAGLVREQVNPALQRFVDVLRGELLPAARGEDHVGVGALPIGADCYRALITHHISEARTADELHALGLAEIARIDDEFRALGAKALKTKKLPAILERLRSDPALYFETAEEVEAFARESLAAAEAAAPKFFGRLPSTPCEVRTIPDYSAPYTTIAYYNPPTADEGGIYYINVYAPTTRPRYEARVLAIHEAVPGHHTQIALAQELAATPAFRRHGGVTVFVEGWALYTERLADEMGLYASDLDRLGVLSFDAWRASRLVVDTGIHAKGWTRQQAVDFMLAHTALAKNNIVNEVDRYVSWPGQALAYKYGQLEILSLRARAEAKLGPRFDLAGFHDVVLGAGAVTLPILRQRVAAWIDERGAGE